MKIINYSLELNGSRPELIKEKEVVWDAENLNSPENNVKMVNTIFRLNKKAEEHLYMICLNTKGLPMGVFEISHGTVDASLISPREVMIRALLCGATGFVLIHNHPSGVVEPSVEDISVAKRICESGKLMNVNLLDSIIVGQNDEFYSFVKEGVMPC